jgi:hypothetical protein
VNLEIMTRTRPKEVFFPKRHFMVVQYCFLTVFKTLTFGKKLNTVS